jgi:hypothetical protein
MLLTVADAILVYRAANVVEAHALVVRLADEGIEARVLGEPLQGAYAGLRLGGMELAEVWVADDDREAAEPIIDAWRNEHFPTAGALKPTRFQFPLIVLLVVMTYVALVFGSAAMPPRVQDIFAPILHLVLFGAFVAIAWIKVRAKQTQEEES